MAPRRSLTNAPSRFRLSVELSSFEGLTSQGLGIGSIKITEYVYMYLLLAPMSKKPCFY